MNDGVNFRDWARRRGAAISLAHGKTSRNSKPAACLIVILAVVLAACGSRGETGTPGSPIFAASDRGKQPDGWQVDCVIEPATATYQCLAGKYGADRSGKKSVPFIVSYRQIVPGGGFLGPTVEPGIHNSAQRPPVVRVDGQAPISDMSSAELIGQLLAGETAWARYQFWPDDPEEMTVALAGIERAFNVLSEEVREVSRLHADDRTGPSSVSNRDILKKAEIFLEEHGTKASLKAAQNAESLLNQGNIKGHDVWVEIEKVIEALSRGAPAPIDVDTKI